MHVVYALSTDGETRYADMVALSATAVRRLHPEATITVLTDDQSLGPVRSRLEVCPWLVCRVSAIGACSGSARVRSRFVKTQVRGALGGDFLYLDADTIPVRSFGKIFNSAAPLSAAIDRNAEAPAGASFPAWAAGHFDRLGWSHPTPLYLNTGVVFWKDTAQTREFAKLWHENWQRFFSVSDNPADQPAFNHTLRTADFAPGILHDKFNARVGLAPEFARSARICHFYADPQTPGGTALDALLGKFAPWQIIDAATITAAIRLGQVRTRT